MPKKRKINLWVVTPAASYQRSQGIQKGSLPFKQNGFLFCFVSLLLNMPSYSCPGSNLSIYSFLMSVPAGKNSKKREGAADSPGPRMFLHRLSLETTREGR